MHRALLVRGQVEAAVDWRYPRTAELLLGMPGIEVAARPLLYISACFAETDLSERLKLAGVINPKSTPSLKDGWQRKILSRSGTGENGSPVPPAPGTGGPETGRRLDRRPTGEILRHPGRRTGEDRRPGPETGRRLDRRPAGENLRRLHSLLKLAAAGLRTPSRNPPNPVSGRLLVLASGRFSPSAFFQNLKVRQ